VKIYTKTGDGGETGLLGGGRVPKDDTRVGAYGEVDELNALLGLATAHLAGLALENVLHGIQRDLFVLGADLATPAEAGDAAEARIVPVGPEMAERLEALIDRFDAETEPITKFILPGGTAGAAVLQVCRAVCRRAERSVVRLSHEARVSPHTLVYLNRLSDLLFVLARWVNRKEGVDEQIWEGGSG
jgi:cob(I)alamin adenosyltransferase